MTIRQIELRGFEDIYYKGVPMSTDTTSRVETVIEARNKLHARYLRWRYRKTGLRVVTLRWIDAQNIGRDMFVKT